jgi:ribosomal protein S18 acetylase RimI-like enzyme
MIELIPLESNELSQFIDRAVFEGMCSLLKSKEHTDAEKAFAAARQNVTTCFTAQNIDKQLVYHIYVPTLKKRVGYLWLERPYNPTQLSTFVAFVLIEEPYRRRGFAQAALLQAEDITLKLGLSTIELYVFAFNTGARLMYEKLGYYAREAKPWGQDKMVTRFVMSKALKPHAER